MGSARCLAVAAASILVCCNYSSKLNAADADGDLAAIRLHNMDSVLLIHSVLKSSDGSTTLFDGSGTGFIVSAEGYVLTANHVIPVRAPDSILTVEGHLASTPAVTLTLQFITKDDNLDLALVRLPDPGLGHWSPVQFGDCTTVPETATLYALGFELNAFSPSQGILRNRYGPDGKWLTSLNINHGDSGGPVFDIQGHVVGISSGGFDGGNALTVVTPESLARGILTLAAVARPQPPPPPPRADPPVLNQTFTFYRSVNSDVTEPQHEQERFCLPAGYSVQNIASRITTQNGPSHLDAVTKAPDSTNCVQASASLAGVGVDRIGPIVVNRRGSGWLGAEIIVTGSKN